MYFSDTISHNGIIEISPDSKYICVSRGSNLNIYLTKQTDLVSSWPVPDTSSHIIWSPNSELILSSHIKKNVIHIFSLQNSNWTGKVSLIPSGISGIWWCSDSLQVCVVSEFQLKLSIWSMADMSINYIKNPKFEDKGWSFNSNGRFMLLAERHEIKDYIGIYSINDWQLVNHFLIDCIDLEDVKWTNHDDIIIIDNCIGYQLLIYSPLGNIIARHKLYENELGIKCMSLSPNEKYLAVGSYDQKVRIFSKICWRILTEFEHKIEKNSPNVYKEEEYKEEYTEESLYSRYLIIDAPMKLPCSKVAKEKSNPAIGISCCEWSFNSLFLATRNGIKYIDNNPSVVWIWSLNDLNLNVLMIQLFNIKHIEWSPKSNHLAFCTGTGKLFLWSSQGASVCEIPLEIKDFRVNKIQWANNGNSMLISDKNRFIIIYPQFESRKTLTEIISN